MTQVTGPQFIALQVDDLHAAKQFYTEQLGLAPTEAGPAHAVVFDTHPIPFAIRTPSVDLADSTRLGWGVALWLACEQVDSMHERLKEYGVTIVEAPYDGPFGRTFSFEDPFGYRLTLNGTPG